MSPDFFARGDIGALVLQIGHQSLHRYQVLALGLVVHDVSDVLGRDALATYVRSRSRRDSITTWEVVSDTKYLASSLS